MPTYSIDEKKEIMEVIDACSRELGVVPGARDLEAMTTRLLPFYGPDLFRLLWQIPTSMKLFPSADRIIARLKQGPVPPPKNAKPHDFKEVVESVFGKCEPETPLGGEAAKIKAREECLNAVLPGRKPPPPPPPPRPVVEVPFAFEIDESPGAIRLDAAHIANSLQEMDFVFEEEKIEPDFVFDT